MFSRRYVCIIVFLLFIGGGCVSKSQSDLTKALSGAVKEQKISQKRMVRILSEYDMLQEEDKENAREYALKIISTIELGGDSSHIDVIRTQFVKRKIEV